MAVIGCDVDGIISDFPTAFNKLLIETSGVNRFPPSAPIHSWNWFKDYGYTSAEVSAAWEHIKASDSFWKGLTAYPWAQEFMWLLHGRVLRGDDLYFITSRPGKAAKYQTEVWLHKIQAAGAAMLDATVLISGQKGLCCDALGVDVYIDDKPENLLQVVHTGSHAKLYMLNQPWNLSYEDVKFNRISNPCDMIKELGR